MTKPYLCFVCITISALFCGCSQDQSRANFAQANALFSQGNYSDSLVKYEQALKKNPATGDRALFEMGIIHAYPTNQQKDYQKSLECFQRLIREYPSSAYRQNSEMMISNIGNVSVKDQTIAAQQARVKALQEEIEARTNEVAEMRKKIKYLEQKVFDFGTRNGPIDRILVEKKARRLMLISKGEVLKTYRVALGGNPDGPKEREGDKKTPEGTYVIDSRNRESFFHRSLHISYPNEKDRQRASEMGVSPGGNIMIHGIKKGYSWVGDAHTEVDWTEGCIAVTDEEIEEIVRVTPNGTVVEIRP